MLGEYNDVLKDAWRFTKHNRFMWWFGFFAVFLGGLGGEYEMLVKNLVDMRNTQGLFAFLDPQHVNAQFTLWLQTASEVGPLIWAMALVGVIVGLFFIWVIMISQAALIHGSGRRIPKRGMLFDRMFAAGREFWSPVLALNLLAKAIVLVLLVALALPIMHVLNNYPTSGWLIALYIVSFIVLVPASILVSFLLKYAMSYVVLKGASVGQSIVMAWQLFVRNWMVTLELALLIFALNILYSLGMVMVLVLFALPLQFMGAFFIAAGFDIAFWILFVFAALVFFAVIFVFAAGFSTFQWAAWTKLFVELTKERRTSMVMRWIRTLFPRTSERIEEELAKS